jgi:hypothetical protein
MEVKNVPILLLLALSVPACGMAATIYTYTGNSMTCMGTTCPVLADAITLTLEFGGPLATSTEYANSVYENRVVVSSGDSTAGLTDIGSLLTGWTVTDGVNTITSADANTELFFDLALDGTGAVTSWYIGAVTDPTVSGDAAQIGTTNNKYNTMDTTLYAQRLATGGTDTSWWMGTPTTNWTVSSTAEAPEPGTMGLLALSLSALAILRRRQAR